MQKRKITLNYPKSAAMGFFQGTQERVRNSRGRRAISVRVTEVLHVHFILSTGQRVHGHGHYVPPTNMGHSSRPPQGQGHMNPAYMQHYPNPPDPTYRDLYPSAPMQAPPVAPTAPMPPPYTVEPPSYVSTKDLPPPPAYSTVVSHSRPGYKYDEYYGSMPPPST